MKILSAIRQQNAQPLAGWHHWLLWTLHPLSPYLHPYPYLHSQSLDCQPSIRLAFLSLGTQLHYRDELSYCEDPTTPSCRRGWSLAGHRGIMRWPGFRGQFTHCLKSISRNASLTTPSPQPRALSQPHQASMCWTTLCMFYNICVMCVHSMDTTYCICKTWLFAPEWPVCLS